MLTPTELVQQYHKLHGKQPGPQWLAANAKIPLFDAEHVLGQGKLFDAPEQIETKQAKESPKAVELPRSSVPAHSSAAGVGESPKALENITKWIVLGFATLADLGLAIFFYWSLGFDLPSKLALGLWGFVMTSGKVWGWINRRYVLAAWSAALSIVATVSIFLAVIDTQSAQVQAGASNDSVMALNRQISAKEADNATLRQRLADTPADFVSASERITKAMQDNDRVLLQLRQELATAGVLEHQKKEFSLDAWKIFSQLTNFAWEDPSHVFALCLILAISILFEMLIYATSPRRMKDARQTYKD